MTPEDLAWVQTRLKNCTNVRHQLKICAECLCTKQSDLLVRLGYGSMDELCAAYPVRRVSLLPKRVRNTVPPEAMLEGVLCYYGGFDFDAVRKMLGCTQDMACRQQLFCDTVRCGRTYHPALAPQPGRIGLSDDRIREAGRWPAAQDHPVGQCPSGRS